MRLRKKSNSSNTRDTCLRSLRRFVEYAKITTDVLIRKTKALKAGTGFKRRHAEERLDGWFADLEKEGLEGFDVY